MTTQTIPALSIARPLNETLAQAPFSGRVLGRFERACNLVDSAGRVIALTLPEVGNGPFSIVVAGERGLFDSLRVSQPVTADERGMVIGNWLLDPRGAALWEPKLPRLLKPLTLTSTLVDILKPYQDWPAPAEGGSVAQRVNERARQAARQLHEAIFVSGVPKLRFGRQSRALPLQPLNSAKLEATVGQLVGLGSGLTPAGDDYLIGVMAALWLLERPEIPPQITSMAIPKTTALSAAFLQAAGQGQFVESWHGLVYALNSGDTETIGRAVERIAHFGASSGRDALAGFSATIS